MVPGKKPRLSPASTIGRVSTMRPISLRCSAATAMAQVRNVFPVPAGPSPNVIEFARMESMKRFCPADFGRIALPLYVSTMSLRSALGDISDVRSKPTSFETDCVVGASPSSVCLNRSLNSSASESTSASSPASATSSPRTVMRASNDSSTWRRSSSFIPVTSAISTP